MWHTVRLVAMQLGKLLGVLFRIGEVRRQKIFLAASANSVKRRADAPATIADCVATSAVEFLEKRAPLFAQRCRRFWFVACWFNDVGLMICLSAADAL